MTRRLTFLFAVAAGAAVGNLYWAQPLLDFIAHSLHASPATTGWLITATQLGYAVGILLIVPLGDVVNRRWLIPLMMTGSAAVLVACALAPSTGFLFFAITALGLTTVGGQILAPLAAFIVAAFAGHSLAGVLIAIVLLDIAIQGVNILNQTRLFALSDQARSRLNTAFVTGNFIGGAIGSGAAALLWPAGGWTAITSTGTALCCLALVIWAVGRRGPLITAKPR
jgi:predicted MFS family arabinose efflux permease